MMEHTCSYYCERPECIRAQRDELRDRLKKVDQGGAVACELCGDNNAEMFLHPRCHMTAPLQVSRNGNEVILKCYLPECGREVTRFTIAPNTHPQADPALAKRLLADAKYHKSVYVQFMHEEDFKRMENCREAAAALGGGK